MTMHDDDLPFPPGTKCRHETELNDCVPCLKRLQKLALEVVREMELLEAKAGRLRAKA